MRQTKWFIGWSLVMFVVFYDVQIWHSLHALAEVIIKL